MCNAFSSSVQPAGIGRLLPLMAIVQGVATVAQEWRRVEEFREFRLLKEQEFHQDRTRIRAQLRVFEGTLTAHVALEQARATAFVAAMAAISPTQVHEAVRDVLGMARDLLDRPLALPGMHPEWRW